MDEIVKKLSYFAGEALESLSQADDLFPIYGYLDSDNKKKKVVVVGGNAKESGEECQKRFEQNSNNGLAGAIFKNEFLSTDEFSSDALTILFKNYRTGDTFEVAIIYSPASSTKGFKVRKFSLLDMSNYEPEKADLTFNNFLAGLSEHKEGKRLIYDEFEPL